MPDYAMEVKGEAYLATFVDPGPAFDPAVGPDAPFFQSVIEQSAEMVIAFGHDGVISYANDAVRVLLGYDPASLVGTSVLDLVAPDDLENAAETIRQAAQVVGWRPPRPFRLRHASGSWITFEVAGLSLFDDPRVQAIVVIARWADSASRADRVLGLLAAHRPAPEILGELVHLLHRPGWALAVTVQYDDGTGGLAAVSSHEVAALTGLDESGTGPWAAARQSGAPVVDIGLETVPQHARAAARPAGFVSCWAIPVRDPIGATACVIVWNAEPLEPELGQDLVLRRLVSLIELTLDGRARAVALEREANCDPLTGLWNRRYLETAGTKALAQQKKVTAVAVCDLDGFKQVNDGLGHPAGDLVIQTVADRLRAAVRGDDMVVRLGGDEYALFCTGLDAVEQAEALAQRLVATVCEPIAHESGPITVGVSIGVAVAPAGAATAVTLDDLIREADGLLLAAKAAGKATYRLAVVDP